MAQESLFCLALGVETGMNLQASDRTPPSNMSLNVSPSTYISARRHNHINAGGRSANHVKMDFNMNAEFVSVQHRQEMSVGYYFDANMPKDMCVLSEPYLTSMPNAQHLKLALQLFDDKELFQGLGRKVL